MIFSLPLPKLFSALSYLQGRSFNCAEQKSARSITCYNSVFCVDTKRRRGSGEVRRLAVSFSPFPLCLQPSHKHSSGTRTEPPGCVILGLDRVRRASKTNESAAEPAPLNRLERNSGLVVRC